MGGWAFYQIFKKGDLTGSQYLVGVLGKERGDFFQGGVAVSIDKNKLKSEVFNDKRSL